MTDNPLTLNLTSYVDATLFKDGRPHVRGRRMSVYDVSIAARSLTVEQIAYEFTLTPEQVLAALVYYERNAETVLAFERTADEKYGHLYNKDSDK